MESKGIVRTFNRTIEELKLGQLSEQSVQDNTFNRTIEELK